MYRYTTGMNGVNVSSHHDQKQAARKRQQRQRHVPVIHHYSSYCRQQAYVPVTSKFENVLVIYRLTVKSMTSI